MDHYHYTDVLNFQEYDDDASEDKVIENLLHHLEAFTSSPSRIISQVLFESSPDVGRHELNNLGKVKNDVAHGEVTSEIILRSISAYAAHQWPKYSACQVDLIVDLAGSECLKKMGAKGIQPQEGSNINKDL